MLYRKCSASTDYTTRWRSYSGLVAAGQTPKLRTSVGRYEYTLVLPATRWPKWPSGTLMRTFCPIPPRKMVLVPSQYYPPAYFGLALGDHSPSLFLGPTSQADSIGQRRARDPRCPLPIATRQGTRTHAWHTLHSAYQSTLSLSLGFCGPSVCAAWCRTPDLDKWLLQVGFAPPRLPGQKPAHCCLPPSHPILEPRCYSLALETPPLLLLDIPAAPHLSRGICRRCATRSVLARTERETQLNELVCVCEQGTKVSQKRWLQHTPTM